MLTRYKKTMDKVVKNYKKQGIEFLKSCTEKQLGEIVRLANNGYYNNDKPIMTDLQYDKLKLIIEDTYPNSVINKIVPHTTITVTKNKVKLPYEMWSMDKIKPDTGAIYKWMEDHKGPYILSAKLDGVSALYVSKDGKKNLYTRGDDVRLWYSEDLGETWTRVRALLPKSAIGQERIHINKASKRIRFRLKGNSINFQLGWGGFSYTPEFSW